MAIMDYINSMLEEGKVHKTSKGTQYSYCCPFCSDHKRRLFIHFGKQKYICHHCNSSGSLIGLISDYSKITWKEAHSIFREHYGYEAQLSEDLENEIYNRLHKVEVPISSYYKYPLPEEFILIEDARGKTGKEAISYLKSRNITLDMCERYYIGYCAEGDYANRIIMPDVEDGNIVYWQARTWEPEPKNPLIRKHYRKVLNPSLTPRQVEQGIVAVDKSQVISNIDLVKQHGVAILCEGKMDAYTLLDSGACLHGKYLSDDQLMKLVFNKQLIKTIVVMLDGDAFKYTLSAAKRISKYFNDVLVCKLPDGADPNSLGTKACIELIDQAIPYTQLFEVKARLRGWLQGKF